MSNALPFTPLAPLSSRPLPLGPDAVSCARHAHTRAARTCPDCHAPLCSACALDAAHQRCPRCRAAAGLPPTVVSSGWLSALFKDSARHGLQSLHRTPLPVLAAVWMGLSAFAVGDPMEGAAFSASAGQPFGSLIFGVLMLSALRVPMLDAPNTWDRVVRIFRAGLLQLGVLAIAIAMVGAATAIGSSGFMVFSVFMTLVAVAVYPMFSVTHALHGILRKRVTQALTLPFRSGAATWGWCFGCQVVLSVVGAGAQAVISSAGGLASLLGSTVWLCVGTFLQAIVAVACARFVLDAHTLRESQPR